jgi:hypothetical protein
MAGPNTRTVIAIGAVVLAVAAGAAVVALAPREPPPAPVEPKFPQPPEAHPVIPSPEEPPVRPPQAFCEARDIAMVAVSLRAAHKVGLGAAGRGDKRGEPAACHATDSGRTLSGTFDTLTKRTGACVARDSELDSQWNQLDSAVLAYGRCIDCTRPRDERLTGCKRMAELVDAALKSVK